MDEGWEHNMTRSFACLEATSAFLARDLAPDRVDDSAVTDDIDPEDVSAALKRIKRGKSSGTDELNNTFYK